MITVNLNCKSDVRPEKAVIENITDGKCDIVLNDNLKIDENEETTYYTYDIYRIEKMNYRPSLENEIKNEEQYNIWLNFAKEQYQNQAEKISIEERLSTAEAVIAEMLGGEE